MTTKKTRTKKKSAQEKKLTSQKKNEDPSTLETPPTLSILNNQPPEKGFYDPKGMVDVVNVWPTIQGEGPFQGKPAVFIRLAGCNLQCPNCDTDYTSGRKKLWPPAVVDIVQSHMKRCLVVLTGGEPFRQNIAPLVRLLLNTGYQVQIESNGTVAPPDDENNRFPWAKCTICCSPKTAKIDPEFEGMADYFKYILDAEHVDPSDGLPSASLGMSQRPARPPNNYDVPIYVQPMDTGDERTTDNMKAVISSCMKFNYHVCVQLHKILGME